MILAPPWAHGDTNLTIYLDDRERGAPISCKKLNIYKNIVTNFVRWWGGGRKILKYKKMTTFSFYSFRFLKISPYIN